MLAEPLIYVYDYTRNQRELDISVINLKGRKNLILDPPTHNKSATWNIRSSFSGKIIDLYSNRLVDSLFWEIDFTKPPIEKTGFVVAKQDLKKFFAEKLEHMGLNERERTEFIDYWTQQLVNMPYYYIHFYFNSYADQEMPLRFSEKPDSVFRVWMNQIGLEQPFQIEPQVLPSGFARQGLTVVEWGGFLDPKIS